MLVAKVTIEGQGGFARAAIDRREIIPSPWRALPLWRGRLKHAYETLGASPPADLSDQAEHCARRSRELMEERCSTATETPTASS